LVPSVGGVDLIIWGLATGAHAPNNITPTNNPIKILLDRIIFYSSNITD
jgi:hypothetical protein